MLSVLNQLGLEERKQILYLLGPVGGGKSSLAEKLKALMQKLPIYVLSADGERSPVNDHPLLMTYLKFSNLLTLSSPLSAFGSYL